jgi:hypothetical protein
MILFGFSVVIRCVFGAWDGESDSSWEKVCGEHSGTYMRRISSLIRSL